ncbi:MAG: T9SS type A sorting domain-containing protein [Lewinellaceae bacterium]|nr:T9SS type A sorting domain-containing protein [Saprospiraceae bacterium]MCB9339309.1 T9SS type A sorting domain-containing protein [Lewinellaceae bacterium]
MNDINGRILNRAAFQDSETRINTGHLASGMYFIKILDANQNQIWEGKFVKQ